MGGEAAKERRRLKRLEAQAQGDGAAKAFDNKSDAPKQTKATGEKKEGSSSTELQLRIQRKMARKASGQFKAYAAQNPKPPAPAPAYKRKSEDADKNRKGPYASKKPFNKDTNDRYSQRKDSFKGKGNVPAKKNNTTKHKVKKPKHLKRKMDQLSKTISEGNSIEDLEDQMKQLAEKMEELKKLKQKDSVAVESKDDVGKETQSPVRESKDDAGKEKQNVAVEANDAAEKDSKQEDTTALKKQSEAVESKDDTEKENAVVESKVASVKDKQNLAVESKDVRNDDSGAESNNESQSEGGGKNGGDKGKASVQDVKVTKTDKIQTEETSSSSSSSGSSDDDSSSDEDEIAETSNTRSRGKRGRGRVDNNPEEKRSDKTEEPEPPSKKTSRKDDKRRCIGRKPITDFVIGKTYSGTVKYIKPKLGAFIDLGAHSDAFCHISCISDTFVSSVMNVLKVDDVVENARVVEIDREKKRVTVSLRSEEVADNEQDKLKATRQYEKNRNRYSGRDCRTEISPAKGGYGRVDRAESKPSADANSGYMGTNNAYDPPAVQSDLAKSNADLKRERKLQRRAERRGESEQTEQTENSTTVGGSVEVQVQSAPSFPTQPGPKSGADLKRERKLARRAERRAAASGEASQ